MVWFVAGLGCFPSGRPLLVITEGHFGVLQLALQFLNLIGTALVLLFIVVDELVEFLVLQPPLLRLAVELVRPLLCSGTEGHSLDGMLDLGSLVFLQGHDLGACFLVLQGTVIGLAHVSGIVLLLLLLHRLLLLPQMGILFLLSD